MLGKCPSGKFDYFSIKVNIYWESKSKLVLRFGFITKMARRHWSPFSYKDQ